MPGYERHEPEKTLLHQVVREELESFLSRAGEAGAPVARFVEREIRAYLDCGVLANGFLRVHCDDCGHDRVVAFSCKGRGFCPSCGGRRMADTAGHLVERVLPEVPIRQWCSRCRTRFDCLALGTRSSRAPCFARSCAPSSPISDAVRNRFMAYAEATAPP